MSLQVEGLNVSLRGVPVLRDIAFKADRGEFLIIVGPNGAGKTTLIKAIACLIASSGDLRWDGSPLATLSAAERARAIAYLPQGHVAHWPICARDVVTLGRAPFASSLTKLSREDRQAVDHALAAVGAEGFADRPVTELSGGERARIMLARALAVGAPLLLADEPAASLDPAHQLGVMEILSAEARSGRLVLAVSHDLLLAARHATRIMVLDEGRIAALGTPQETLTGALLRRVFKVEPIALESDGISIEIPWTPLPSAS